MTVAALLLAFVAAGSTPAGDRAAEPILLDFHAQWCGPCHRARPAVKQLASDGYPIKTVDIDQEPELARRYHVNSVPTFIVADRSGRELDRISGLHSASELARFYKSAKAKAQPPAGSNAHVGAPGDDRTGANDDDDSDPEQVSRRDDTEAPAAGAPRAEPHFSNPKPWETVVRIRVIGAHSTGFGSGTIIHSTPDESLILTCAHIFKVDGRRQFAPAEFPRRVKIDLFDGNLQGTDPARVHFLEAVEGKAVDYDFKRDVGLIRIRPGRRLPASRVVPPFWEPQSHMKVLAVGCSEGSDATAWHTVIKRPRIQNFLAGNPSYEAVECDWAPKQGRSGGGLYTSDGYVAGVCNFAEPQGNNGLYATPRSIYALLDRNNLADLYAPSSRGAGILLAGRGRGTPSRLRPDAPVSVARSQSPDGDEPDRSLALAKSGDVVIPSPGLLGIADPVPPAGASTPQAASGTTRHTAWQRTPGAATAAKSAPPERALATDLKLDPAADSDHFNTAADESRTFEPEKGADDSFVTTNPAPSGKTRWRAVKPAPATAGSSSAHPG
jgi:thiol-disulfide isomerase/thioredoxin